MLKFEGLIGIDRQRVVRMITSLSTPPTVIIYVGARAAKATAQQRAHVFSVVVKKRTSKQNVIITSLYIMTNDHSPANPNRIVADSTLLQCLQPL